jgi:hypothetical protein
MINQQLNAFCGIIVVSEGKRIKDEQRTMNLVTGQYFLDSRFHRNDSFIGNSYNNAL